MWFESWDIDVNNYEIINKPEIQDIINTVSLNNYSTDYAIRYVVVNISRLVKRDTKFFLSSEDERLKQLYSKTYSEYPNVICKTLSELIRDVLDILGIKSTVVKATNSNVPLYALIVDWENGRYFIDALGDLTKSQYHMQPFHYGIFPESTRNILDFSKLKLIKLLDETIKDMDINLGIINWKRYFSDYINDIKINFTSINHAKTFFDEKDNLELIRKKMYYISNNFLNVYQMDGPIERKTFYTYLWKNLFNKNERNSFNVINKNEEGYPVFVTIKFNDEILIFKEVKQGIKYLLQETLEM